MSRSVASSVENNFINGLVTEATALNFPEAACTETSNCIFTLKGSVTRRLGLDYESGYATRSVGRSSTCINSFFWRNAAGDGANSFVALQVGTIISFYKVGAAGNLSANLHGTTIDITTFNVTGTTNPERNDCQFASGAGYLFVTHPQLDPFVVSYDSAGNTFTATKITVQIRDFKGVNDTLAITDRINSLSALHKYNLLNQGWPDIIVPSAGSYASTYIDNFHTALSVYPSNVDVWWLFKNASDVFDPATTHNNIDRGNSHAPQGKFILEAFNQDRSTVSGVTTIPIVSSSYHRPSCVAFFAGRVWYAGVASQDFNNRLYFSQIVKSTDQIGKCYQQNDPTNETLFDLLATDGGDLQILEAGAVIKLLPLQSSLLVFCTNGVWAITGSIGTGFSPTDFSVRKLASIPSISFTSFVDVGGTPMWWNTDGIYILQGNDSLGQVKIDSITEKKIKAFFSTIPVSSKQHARGAYDPNTRTVKWIYRSTSAATIDDNYTFDVVLCFNVNTGAFYTYSVPISTASIANIIVIDGNGNTAVPISSTYKYLTSKLVSGTTYLSTFAEERDSTYVDWKSADSVGISFDSHFISGYKVHGDAQKKFQSNYVYLYGNTSSTSCVCNIQSIFDYTTDSTTGRWSTPQALSFPFGNKARSFKRVKLRGSGHALQLKVYSTDNQPFEIDGWSIFETGNANI